MSHSLIEDYNLNLASHLPQLKEDLEAKLRHLVEAEGILVYSLNGRVKARESLERKIARPDRNYLQILDVTDLLGLRIVTHSEDQIHQVAKIIENEFNVDFGNSTNKLLYEDSQKFGYRSLHYVCLVPEELNANLKHLKTPFRFEIQIRTMLQHVWSEIEHDIGYKTAEQLPKELRRRFSQVASLLEVADREFASIRTDLKIYEDKIKKKGIHQDFIDLDQISLELAIQHEDLTKIDKKISSFLQAPLSHAPFYPDYLLKVVRSSGLKRLGDVLWVANQLHDSIPRFLPIYFNFASEQWGLEKKSLTEVQRGYGLLFLAHLWILHEESLFIDKVNRLTKFYHEIDYPNDLNSAKKAAQSLIAFLKSSNFIQDTSQEE